MTYYAVLPLNTDWLDGQYTSYVIIRNVVADQGVILLAYSHLELQKGMETCLHFCLLFILVVSVHHLFAEEAVEMKKSLL